MISLFNFLFRLQENFTLHQIMFRIKIMITFYIEVCLISHYNNTASYLKIIIRSIAFQGKVVTETFTDYKEINDDSDASGFGSGFDSKFSSFPDFDSSFKTSSSKALQSSSTSPFKKSNLSTKSSSSSSSSSEDEDDFEEDALKKHNEYRQKHGCPPLKLDKKVYII